MVMLLIVLGSLALLGGWIWLLVLAFSESVLWGVLVLLVPFAGLVFLVMHWDEAKMPGMLIIAGIILRVAGTVIS